MRTVVLEFKRQTKGMQGRHLSSYSEKGDETWKGEKAIPFQLNWYGGQPQRE